MELIQLLTKRIYRFNNFLAKTELNLQIVVQQLAGSGLQNINTSTDYSIFASVSAMLLQCRRVYSNSL
jgi:hypothetical protein